MKPLDLTGRKVGRLLVLAFHETKRMGDGKSYRFWLCRCDCGTRAVIATSALAHKSTLSCGCLQRERTSLANGTHFQTNTVEFWVWERMRRRCTDHKSADYKNYGERGIKVCERWSDFQNFLSDMGMRPSPNHSIERKDNSKGYAPDNCEWATRQQQQRNKRTNRVMAFDGRSLTVAEWAELLGVRQNVLHHRNPRGWSVERVLTQPIRGREYAYLP